MHIEHVYPEREALFSAVYTYCTDALHTDLGFADKVTCYLSGGSTPLPLYNKLTQSRLPWHRIFPALVDERWVDINDPASNEGMLRKVFSGQNTFLQQLVGMKDAHASARQAEAQCCERYDKLPSMASFCLLGMGPDGHTASLFPQAQGLDAALHTPQKCSAIIAQPSSVTGTLTERLSLSLTGIIAAKRIVLLFTGADKWEVYQKALNCTDPKVLPVSAVLQQTRTIVDVFYSP